MFMQKAGDSPRVFVLLPFVENGYFFLTAFLTGLAAFFAAGFLAAAFFGTIFFGAAFFTALPLALPPAASFAASRPAMRPNTAPDIRPVPSGFVVEQAADHFTAGVEAGDIPHRAANAWPGCVQTQ